MKQVIRIAFIVTAYTLVPVLAPAQETDPVTSADTVLAEAVDGFQMEFLTVGAGSDPLSSGISVTTRWRSDATFLEGSFQSEQAWLIYGRYVEMGRFTAELGASAGHFQKAPNFGPYMSATFRVTDNLSISGLFWPAVFTEEPEDWKMEEDGVENPEDLLKGLFGGGAVNYNVMKKDDNDESRLLFSVGGSYHILNFLDDETDSLVGLNIGVPLNKSTVIRAAVTVPLSDGEVLPWAGTTYSP